MLVRTLFGVSIGVAVAASKALDARAHALLHTFIGFIRGLLAEEGCSGVLRLLL